MMDRRKSDRRPYMAFDNYVIDVQDLIKRVWRRRYLALALAAIPTLMGFVYLAAKPDYYRATAQVLFDGQSVKIADMQEAFPGITLDNLTGDTQARIIGSRKMMNSVIETLGLHINDKGDLAITPLVKDKDGNEVRPKPADQNIDTRYRVLNKYASGLKVTPIKASRIVEIGYVSTDPYLASELANAHALEYVESQVRQKLERAGMMNDSITSQVEVLKKTSMEKAQAVQDFREKNGMIRGRTADDLVFEQVSNIAAQLVPLEARKVDLQAQYEAIQTPGNQDLQVAIQNSNVVQGLKTQASSARQELRALSAKYGKNHPDYIEAQRKVSQIEGDLARETSSIRETLKNELDTVMAQYELLNDRLSEVKAQSDVLRQNQIQLQSLELEASASAKMLDSFIARSEEITSQMNFAQSDARVLNEADIPVAPEGTKKALMMFVIAFLSSLFSMGIVLFLSFLDNGVESIEDIRKTLNMRMMGVLPDVRNPIQEVVGGQRSMYLEEIKRIYLHISNKPETKTLLLTAASTGEGKTSLTLALAAYLVSTGRKTIVVDADLQTPDVARIAGVENTIGLAEYLHGNADLKSVIHYDERGIAIIPAGGDGTKVDIGSSNLFKTLLDTLKETFDYVLVDATPVLNSSDAETVASLVDQVIMIVAYAKTPKKNVKKAADTLRQFAPEVPSVILNKADLKNVA